jgi:hypothetical protein
MISQSADFSGVLFGYVAGMGKYRGKYTAQMFYFFFGHFEFLLSDSCIVVISRYSVG